MLVESLVSVGFSTKKLSLTSVVQVEPPHGSTAGGTELHITGAGFAYVTQAGPGGLLVADGMGYPAW